MQTSLGTISLPWENDAEPVGWGIVGTGAIARVFAGSLTSSGVGHVAQVVSRTKEGAQSFCATMGGEPCDDLGSVLETGQIQALYIATPHPSHADAAKMALAAGVPVLCEKPMTCTADDTTAVVECARQHETPLVEAWMYRCHPQISALQALIRNDAVGRIHHIEASFGFRAEVKPEHRLRNPKLGGGAILDIGGYPLSLAMFVAGVCEDRAFQEPSFIAVTGQRDSTGVEDDTTADLFFYGGLEASVRASTKTEIGMSFRCQGERGQIELPTPFLPEGQRGGTRASIHVTVDGHTEAHEITTPLDCYAMEARAMAQLIARGNGIEPTSPMIGHEESIALARAMDTWRDAASGLPEETPHGEAP